MLATSSINPDAKTMTTAKATVLVGGAALLLLAFKKAYSATALNFYPSQILSADFVNGVPIVRVRVAVQNPTDSSFYMKSFVANLYANDSLVGTTYTYFGKSIAPLSTSYIDISLRLSLIGIATDLYQAIVNHTGFSQQIKMVAHTLIDSILVPVTLDYKLG